MNVMLEIGPIYNKSRRRGYGILLHGLVARLSTVTDKANESLLRRPAVKHPTRSDLRVWFVFRFCFCSCRFCVFAFLRGIHYGASRLLARWLSASIRPRRVMTERRADVG